MADSGGRARAVPRVLINPPVFVTASVLALAFVLYAVLFPVGAEATFSAMRDWTTATAGWFYVLSVALFLIFVVLLGLSGAGAIKLGRDESTPEYSYGSWFAMLFSAGMGIGLMFFGVAEPLLHMIDPPVGDALTVEAARQAMRITFFHWGVHAWAIYAVVALALAYFAYRHGLPLAIRSAFYPLIGERIHGPIGHAVDVFAVLGTLFGVATSLGVGVVQINAGLNELVDLPVGVGVQVILIAVITLIATLSVGLGLDAGIQRISVLNIVLAIVLVVFVLVAGPTVFLLQTLVQNTGMYLSNLIDMTFNLYAYEPTGWIGGWTLFYWAWWIAWSPFVGMFIARISRGRTIREFVMSVLLVPVGFTFVWMTVFGDTAIHMVLVGGVTGLAEAVAIDESVALFQFFALLPFATVTSVLATLLVVTFFVTSSDSGSLVVDMLTNGGNEVSPTWQRVFWAVVEGLIAAALLLAGGLAALQTATLAAALPFTIVMLLMCWGMIRALRLELVKRVSLREARLTPAGGRSADAWQARLRTIIHHPGREEVGRFLREVVAEALDEVAAESRTRGLDARVVRGDDAERVWFEVRHGDEIDFFYEVRPAAYEPPAFVMRETLPSRRAPRARYRAEVHLREGSQAYDIMGWSKRDVIDDVLDQYERHLHFLSAVR
jgi:choline/glycine/proline betaine transport protein